MTLPDFLLVGAPKAGTTALHVALSAHPSLVLSAEKEPKFFLFDGPPPRGGGPGDGETSRRSVWDRGAYERLFAGAPRCCTATSASGRSRPSTASAPRRADRAARRPGAAQRHRPGGRPAA